MLKRSGGRFTPGRPSARPAERTVRDAMTQLLEEEEFVYCLRPGVFPAHEFFLLREGVGEGNRP